jgi:hypothetical protein
MRVPETIRSSAGLCLLSLFLFLFGILFYPRFLTENSRPFASKAPQPLSISSLSNPGKTFREETSSYSVSWEGYLVAARFTTKAGPIQTPQGNPRLELILEARTVGIVDRYIYKVQDQYRTLADPASMLPLEIFVHTLHGKKETQRHYLLEPRNRQITLDDGTKRKIPPRTFDLPTLFYFLRRVEWKAGRTEKFSLLERGNIYEIQCRLEGTESITLNGKSVPTLKISVRIMAEESPDDTYRIRLYLADSPDRTPLSITANPSWGQVLVKLEELSSPNPGTP